VATPAANNSWEPPSKGWGHKNLDALLRLLESGEVRVVIDKTYPLDQAAGAVTYMLEHHSSGKIAVTA
jgi:NADPH:quinone reductase-like Zn-dependent oxidoreductase